MKFSPSLLAASATLLCAGASLSAHAETGKLLLTGGVSSIDGAAGGGLTPWAVIGSNATEGEIGGTAFVTTARTKDYGLNVVGASVGINDRYELSVAQQDFKTGITGRGLGLPGLHLKQTIVGAKVRVAGDAVLDADTLMPQVAVGVEYKTLGSTGLDGTLRTLGAKREGVDLYVSATKLFLGQSLLVNGTLRATKANQNGLLGYGATLGGGSNNSYSLQPEFSVAYLISKNVAVGAEYRFMRNKLETAGRAAGLGNGLRSEDWKDIFIAWAPNKNVSVTLAYVDLGVIVPATTASRKQTGYYLSAQLAF
ncbi:MAG: DUF3034 family protein [Polaromonas sp.]|uniref:DUF3034 family protein n=1 Tax=Polaromonas sp. TaxID=1869339 RepID=UPI00273047FB|nr:DUF3034 family protein [Polaromonas sp.]MDP1739628.1 DUF3034 family protein [Polaromonas sp.]MDP1955278.1 DUF3034 family protein [Polaromonas sp.]MDP3357645.1 DUF3034 family protein [Polaromonas sp.]MDP3751117.1 DUF3034 family protein [Polaromonas sp.]